VAAASSDGFSLAYEATNVGYSTEITLDDGDRRRGAAGALVLAQQARHADGQQAAKLGAKPTTGSGSNRVVALGARGRDALIAAARDGIYVTSWLGGNLDSTTGDFSLGARGHLIEGGAVGAPCGEMNVTGNIVDLFSRLVEVGDDPWRYSSTLTPTPVFEGVQFSGK